jgi:hypothetical protein
MIVLRRTRNGLTIFVRHTLTYSLFHRFNRRATLLARIGADGFTCYVPRENVALGCMRASNFVAHRA